MSRERVLYITVKIPKASTIDDTAQFCFEALTSWGGGLHPEDPLFDSVKVLAIQSNRRRYKIDEG